MNNALADGGQVQTPIPVKSTLKTQSANDYESPDPVETSGVSAIPFMLTVFLVLLIILGLLRALYRYSKKRRNVL